MDGGRDQRWIFYMLMTPLVPAILWFGGLFLYTFRSLPAMPLPNGRETAWTDTAWSYLPAFNERCILANNVWNKNATGNDFEQQVFEEQLNGKQVLGWRWRAPWQMWPRIAAYPEVICGNKPWDEPTGTFAGLPFHPGMTRMTVNYDVRLQATGTYNLAFSMWAVSALPPSPRNIRCEVMIWIAKGGQQPSGMKRGNVEFDGVVYDTYINEHQRDASGANPNEWTYIAFVARTPVLHGPLDLTRFLDTLRPLKIVTPDLWITNVELGDEVAQGAGIAEVKDFGLNIDPQAQSGLETTPDP